MRKISSSSSHSEELNRDREVWVKHYSSNYQILLVGERDFSFSCSLVTLFRSASNICASSLDSYANPSFVCLLACLHNFCIVLLTIFLLKDLLKDDVVTKYSRARSNLKTLKRLGTSLLHGVDATKLKQHPHFHCRRFDRIIFNFPHAGFDCKESDSYLTTHRGLVFGFFRGASHTLRANGEIHVAHKNKAPFCHWNPEELANKCSLVLKQCVAFEKKDYPRYENKRGDGSRCDRTFILGDCSTFRFHVAKELHTENMNGDK
ncbi:hypothetical protein Bca4012_037108 [Brassica carinata]|uniref:25S rRNA (uridine-N(3))-methyltransferase BMT5-like domain-containing protein n=1 Tax=Brassica carinata TaxID=52824 RepID=A0A8X7WE62_BRACI|nr:hypothetical protein Bca52824_010797 [Brassica carinata]